MATKYLDHAQCAARYPRLVGCLKWVAILATSEAGAAIRDFRSGDADMQRWGGGEAVAHFGGPAYAIQRAIACRHIVRRLYRGVYAPR